MRVKAFLLFFSNYDNKFLTTDIDLSMKCKQDKRLRYET